MTAKTTKRHQVKRPHPAHAATTTSLPVKARRTADRDERHDPTRAAAQPRPGGPGHSPTAIPAASDPRPTASDFIPAVDPHRFIDALQSGFIVDCSKHYPYFVANRSVDQRLCTSVSTRLLDPFAPALRVLANEIYGVSRGYWEAATASFRRRYLAACVALGHDPDAASNEADAAVRRWQALLSLAEASRSTLLEWYLSKHEDRGGDRACVLASIVARAPLRWVRPSGPASTTHEQFASNPSVLDMAITAGSDSGWGMDSSDAEDIWTGLLDRHLATSRKRGSVPMLTHRVRADDLARWAKLEPCAVRAAFADQDQALSPGHELFGRRVALPDCRWSDFAAQTPLDLPWLSAQPGRGSEDGNEWQEVTINREVLPYLRRLCMCLDQMSLMTVDENA